MATVNYKQIINLATSGFKGIQNALANFTDLGISAISTNTVNSNTVNSGTITPSAMVSAIENLATVKKSNTTNTVSDNGTFITGRIAYRTGTLNATPTFTSGTRVVSFSYSLPAGYYPANTVSGSYTISQGHVTLGGAAISAGTLASSGEVTNAFAPTAVVAASGATDTSYYYAKITRGDVTRTITEGYIKNNTTDVGTLTGGTSYVKIPSATFGTLTNPSVNLNSSFSQYKKEAGGSETALGDSEIPLKAGDSSPFTSSTPYYKFTVTPNFTVASQGQLLTNKAGYISSGVGSNNISVSSNTVTDQTFYMQKSTSGINSIDESYSPTGLGYNQMAYISKGYYPEDRYFKNNDSPAALTISNSITGSTTQFKAGSSSAVNNEILVSSTSGLTNYYIIKAGTTVDNVNITTPGYISSSVGSITIPDTKYVTKYLPELTGNINTSSSTAPVVKYSLTSSGTGNLNAMQESSSSGSGIVTSVPSGTAGTDYYFVQATARSTTSGSVTDALNVTQSGYLSSDRASAIVASKTTTLTTSLDTENTYKLYIKKPTIEIGTTSNLDSGDVITINGNASENIVSIYNDGVSDFSEDPNPINVGDTLKYATDDGSDIDKYYITVQLSEKTISKAVTPRIRATSGGYIAKSSSYTNGSALNITAKTGGYLLHVPVTTGEAHNGYVTEAGWFENQKDIYRKVYNSTEKCVDFIFNDE